MLIELSGWNNFYVMVGSAAGALIGLQFVVLTLLAQKPRQKNSELTAAAFIAPTIVHFGVTLFVSALLLVPWQMIDIPSKVLGAIGLGGIVYSCIVALRMRRQKLYIPNLWDWFYHFVIPLIAYVILTGTLFVPLLYPDEMFSGIAAATLLLLLVGIHNAWDNIA